MMLMAMRLQKTQLTDALKWTSGVATFKRDPYLMAGYRNFDVMVVGGSGGRAGYAMNPWNDPQLGPMKDYWYGAGGGGGSSKRVLGSLSDLATSIDISVGAAGSNGANGTNTSGDGGRGGNSTFGGVAIAYGGYGGYGAVMGTYSWSKISVGGEGANPDGSKGPLGGFKSGTNRSPGIGTWDNVLMEGSGGGGGNGANTTYSSGSYTYPPQAGGGGANGADGYLAAGEAIQSTYYGGGGGGANIKPHTGGSNEDYGSGYNHGRGGGVVSLKLS